MAPLQQPPDDFESVASGSEILALQKPSKRHHFIGVVTDSKGVCITRGQDRQHAFQITDSFNHFAGYEPMPIAFFTTQDMIPYCNKGDIILLRSLNYNGPKYTFQNFISQKTTQFRILSAGDFSDEAIEKITAKDSPELKRYLTELAQWAKVHVPSDGKLLRHPQPPRPKQKHEITQFSNLIDDKYYTLAGEVVRTRLGGETVRTHLDGMDRMDQLATIYITDYTENDRFHDYLDEAEDDGDGQKDASRIPLGKQTLQLTLFEPHATWARKQRNLLGQFVRLSNVHVKYNDWQAGSQLEGRLHTDSHYNEKVCIQWLSESDPYYNTIKKRRTEYNGKMTQKKLEDLAQGPSAAKSNRGQIRKERRRLEREKLQEKQKEAEQFGGIDAPKSLEFNKHIIPQKTSKAPQPLHSITESSLLQGKTNTGLTIRYPFMNVAFRSNVRVINFYPNRIEDFSHRLDDPGYNDAPNEPDADDVEMDGPAEYEWMFYLVIEDCEKNANGERVQIPLLVHGQEAEFLLNLEASNLKRDIATMAKLRERLFVLWGNVEELKRAGTIDKNGEISNLPFTCCIKEYGAPDGHGAYVRMHRIFDTTIQLG